VRGIAARSVFPRYHRSNLDIAARRQCRAMRLGVTMQSSDSRRRLDQG